MHESSLQILISKDFGIPFANSPVAFAGKPVGTKRIFGWNHGSGFYDRGKSFSGHAGMEKQTKGRVARDLLVTQTVPIFVTVF